MPVPRSKTAPQTLTALNALALSEDFLATRTAPSSPRLTPAHEGRNFFNCDGFFPPTHAPDERWDWVRQPTAMPPLYRSTSYVDLEDDLSFSVASVPTTPGVALSARGAPVDEYEAHILCEDKMGVLSIHLKKPTLPSFFDRRKQATTSTEEEEERPHSPLLSPSELLDESADMDALCDAIKARRRELVRAQSALNADAKVASGLLFGPGPDVDVVPDGWPAYLLSLAGRS